MHLPIIQNSSLKIGILTKILLADYYRLWQTEIKALLFGHKMKRTKYGNWQVLGNI